MKQEPNVEWRIVSEEEYSASLRKKVALTSFGIGILLIGLGLTLLTFRVVLEMRSDMAAGLGLGLKADIGALFSAALFLVCLSAYLLSTGKRAIRDARQIDTGVPLNRANTA